MLFCEPKNRKFKQIIEEAGDSFVSVLFCEPKNRKCAVAGDRSAPDEEFQCSSASRKIGNPLEPPRRDQPACFSALLRAEKSEIGFPRSMSQTNVSFSALLRAEKSEIYQPQVAHDREHRVSVLFCEPKNRKSGSLRLGSPVG